MRELYELCYGVEPEEKDLQLLEIKYQRLLDNGYSDKEAIKILLASKLNILPIELIIIITIVSIKNTKAGCNLNFFFFILYHLFAL